MIPRLSLAGLFAMLPLTAAEPLLTLKGQEIVSEDFHGPTIDARWVRPYGAWTIVDGALQGSARKEDGHNGNCKIAIDCTTAVVQFDLMFDGAGLVNVGLDSAKGHIGRLTIAPHGFTVQKDGSGTDAKDARKVLDTVAYEFKPRVWTTIVLELHDDEVLARVDDTHAVFGADAKFKAAKTRLAFGVHGAHMRLDNVKVFAATVNPAWAATKERLVREHGPAPKPAVTGPDHFQNAQNKKK